MTPFRKSVAWIVGIDDYAAPIPPLQSAVADARAVAAMLRDQHAYEVELRLDAAATRAKLLVDLEQTLPAQLTADDRLVVYFAGHGVAHDGADGPEGALLPHDADGEPASLLSMSRIAAALRALPCRHLLVIIDCCFAGAFRWSSTRNFAPAPPVVYKQRFARFLQERAALALTSASHDQVAQDVAGQLRVGHRPLEGGHSPFAAALLDGLSGNADRPGADGYKDHLITATELFDHVRDVMLTADRAQTPGLWPLADHGRGEFVFNVPGQTPRLLEDPRLDEAANPWRGLRPYHSEHAELFFGRDADTQALLTRVEGGARFTAVVGPSGAGKSSLLGAGLAPALQRAGYDVVGPLHPADLARAPAYAAKAARPVLLVDHLGELARVSPGEREVALAALTRADLPVVVALRTDRVGALADGPLGHDLAEACYPLGLLARDGLRAVVTGPAERRVLYFDPPDLAEALVDAVADRPGGLPLLSFALSELYRLSVQADRGDRALTQADLNAIGGVAGALRQRAEALFAALDPAHQASLRRVMLRMVTVDGSTRARRRVPRWELRHDDPAEQAQVDRCLQTLAEGHLVIQGGQTGAGHVEPAHDALVQDWDRLEGWVDGALQGLPIHRALTEASLAWESTGHSAAYLWHADPRRAPAQALEPLALSSMEQAFLEASARHARARRRTAWGVAAAVGLVVLVLSALGWQQKQARDQLVQQQAVSTEVRQAYRALDDPDPELAAAAALDLAALADRAPDMVADPVRAVTHHWLGLLLPSDPKLVPRPAVVAREGRTWLLTQVGARVSLPFEPDRWALLPGGRILLHQATGHRLSLLAPDGAVLDHVEISPWNQVGQVLLGDRPDRLAVQVIRLHVMGSDGGEVLVDLGLGRLGGVREGPTRPVGHCAKGPARSLGDDVPIGCDEAPVPWRSVARSAAPRLAPAWRRWTRTPYGPTQPRRRPDGTVRRTLAMEQALLALAPSEPPGFSGPCHTACYALAGHGAQAFPTGDEVVLAATDYCAPRGWHTDAALRLCRLDGDRLSQARVIVPDRRDLPVLRRRQLRASRGLLLAGRRAIRLDDLSDVALRPPLGPDVDHLQVAPDDRSLVVMTRGRLAAYRGGHARGYELTWRSAPGARAFAFIDGQRLAALVADRLTVVDIERGRPLWRVAEPAPAGVAVAVAGDAAAGVVALRSGAQLRLRALTDGTALSPAERVPGLRATDEATLFVTPAGAVDVDAPAERMRRPPPPSQDRPQARSPGLTTAARFPPARPLPDWSAGVLGGCQAPVPEARFKACWIKPDRPLPVAGLDGVVISGRHVLVRRDGAWWAAGEMPRPGRATGRWLTAGDRRVLELTQGGKGRLTVFCPENADGLPVCRPRIWQECTADIDGQPHLNRVVVTLAPDGWLDLEAPAPWVPSRACPSPLPDGALRYRIPLWPQAKVQATVPGRCAADRHELDGVCWPKAMAPPRAAATQHLGVAQALLPEDCPQGAPAGTLAAGLHRRIEATLTQCAAQPPNRCGAFLPVDASDANHRAELDRVAGLVGRLLRQPELAAPLAWAGGRWLARCYGERLAPALAVARQTLAEAQATPPTYTCVVPVQPATEPAWGVLFWTQVPRSAWRREPRLWLGRHEGCVPQGDREAAHQFLYRRLLQGWTVAEVGATLDLFEAGWREGLAARPVSRAE